MKKFIVSLTLISMPVIAWSVEYGGFYCTKSDANGQTTLSFVPINGSTAKGIIVLKPAKAEAQIILDSERQWSGSMFITSGGGVFVRGPGNGIPGIEMIDRPEMRFSAEQCKSF